MTIDDAKERRRNDPQAKREREWFAEKKIQVHRIKDAIVRARAELVRQRERRLRTDKDRRNAQILGTSNAAELERIAIENEQRLEIVEERIQLRKQEIRRKKLRKAFQAQPSLRVLKNGKIPRIDGPGADEIERFWEPILGRAKESKPRECEYLREWEETMRSEYHEFSISEARVEQELQKGIRHMKPWKAPGPDGI